MSSDQSLQEYRVVQWVNARGDETLGLDYDLNENSIVFEVGGYLGDWSEAIIKKYNCYIHIFEPVTAYFTELKAKFHNNPKIQVHHFGLADQTRDIEINLNADGSSQFGESNAKREKVNLLDIKEFLQQHRIKHIDLMQVNIEGGELALLDRMIETGIIKMVDNIKVQFHYFMDGAKERMQALESSLSKTHFLTYRYEFVWENWRKKPTTISLDEAFDWLSTLRNELDKLRTENAQLQLELNKLKKEFQLSEQTHADLLQTRQQLEELQMEISKYRRLSALKPRNLLRKLKGRRLS